MVYMLHSDFPLFFMVSKVKLKQSKVLLKLNPFIIFYLRVNREIV